MPGGEDIGLFAWACNRLGSVAIDSKALREPASGFPLLSIDRPRRRGVTVPKLWTKLRVSFVPVSNAKVHDSGACRLCRNRGK
jgi:hypothetical protein